MSKITIAIDGFSACGKSTLSKALAANLGYSYVDSGAMYRCVTLYAIRKGVIKGTEYNEQEVIKLLPEIKISFKFNPDTKSSETYLLGENVEREIRQMPVAENVSKISAIHEVRECLVAMQRELGKGKGIVMDGRDIGTNVFPDAELKIYMTADVDVRVQRRMDEYTSKGQSVSFDEIKKNLQTRDEDDMSRKENPLIKAPKAIVLDNSELSKEQQLSFVEKLIKDLTLKT